MGGQRLAGTLAMQNSRPRLAPKEKIPKSIIFGGVILKGRLTFPKKTLKFRLSVVNRANISGSAHFRSSIPKLARAGAFFAPRKCATRSRRRKFAAPGTKPR
jgi:hypothetical protein